MPLTFPFFCNIVAPIHHHRLNFPHNSVSISTSVLPIPYAPLSMFPYLPHRWFIYLPLLSLYSLYCYYTDNFPTPYFLSVSTYASIIVHLFSLTLLFYRDSKKTLLCVSNSTIYVSLLSLSLTPLSLYYYISETSMMPPYPSSCISAYVLSIVPCLYCHPNIFSISLDILSIPAPMSFSGSSPISILPTPPSIFYWCHPLSAIGLCLIFIVSVVIDNLFLI